MRLGSLRFFFACFAAGAFAVAAVAACGSSDSLSAFSSSGGTDAGSSFDAGFGGDGGGPSTSDASVIEANGIVIVHAATFGAFRLCFQSAGSRQPIPSSDLLPESNLPGVEVGSVVRIPSLTVPPKK